tara:strand:+ start:2036 stop:2212 length:177 start_codon:yes stop_codon:yes gene_type:complete
MLLVSKKYLMAPLLKLKINAIKLKNPIIKKNFGHIYLKNILASFVEINLLIAGAIRKD